MDKLSPIFTPYNFDVEVVTPVHIGMAQEKNYIRGLDYVLKGNEAWIINTDKLFKELQPAELQNLTLQLASGQASRLEPMLQPMLEKDPEKLILGKLKTAGDPNEIRRFYRTGMGHYVLPGTSLKGAIRSIFLAELKTIAEQKNLAGYSRRTHDLETLMGKIDNNLMRFIQVGDVDFTKAPAVEVRRTKVFSADSTGQGMGEEGKWKDTGRHNKQFDASSFVVHYEMLVNGSDSTHFPPVLTVRLGSNLPHALSDHALGTYKENNVEKPKVPNYSNLLAGRSGQWLVETIRAHTHQYLTREKAYFSRFENTDLDKVMPIQDRLDALIRQNKETDSCLLRLGAGVGFHSITGDWQLQSQDHFSDWNARDNAIKNKTRKFAFAQTKEGIDFSLMGFVKLTLVSPEEAKHRQSETPDERNQRMALKKAQARIAAEEQARIQQSAAAKAKLPVAYSGQIDMGTPLEAIIISRDKPPIKVELMIEGQMGVIVAMVGRKAAQVPTEGTTIIVTVSQMKDGVVKEVRFDREK